MTASPNRQNDRTPLGVLVHLAGLCFSVLGAGFIYVFTKNPVTKTNAANALNWQLFVLVAGLILIVLSVGIGTLINPFLSIITAIASLALAALNLAVCLLATFKAYSGEAWSYPVVLSIVEHEPER